MKTKRTDDEQLDVFVLGAGGVVPFPVGQMQYKLYYQRSTRCIFDFSCKYVSVYSWHLERLKVCRPLTDSCPHHLAVSHTLGSPSIVWSDDLG